MDPTIDVAMRLRVAKDQLGLRIAGAVAEFEQRYAGLTVTGLDLRRLDITKISDPKPITAPEVIVRVEL